MTVRYKGQSSKLSLLNGKEYEVLSFEHSHYRVFDETDEDYLYPMDEFEVIDDSPIRAEAFVVEQLVSKGDDSILTLSGLPTITTDTVHVNQDTYQYTVFSKKKGNGSALGLRDG